MLLGCACSTGCEGHVGWTHGSQGIRPACDALWPQIPHLVELGITAVEILPVLEFDELEFQRTPNARDHMVNVWGYSHINFFAPMARFAEAGGGALAAAREFKQLVKALHAAGIEVILDVVYNHTNEGEAAALGARIWD